MIISVLCGEGLLLLVTVGIRPAARSAWLHWRIASCCSGVEFIQSICPCTQSVEMPHDLPALCWLDGSCTTMTVFSTISPLVGGVVISYVGSLDCGVIVTGGVDAVVRRLVVAAVVDGVVVVLVVDAALVGSEVVSRLVHCSRTQ